MSFNLDFSWDQQFDPPNAQQTLDRMLRESDTRLVATMQRTANRIERDAKRRAPVDTGNLRASIENEVTPRRTSILAEIGTNVEYAPHVEYGTNRMTAQPFMRPAFDDATSRLEREIRMAVAEAADNAGSL